MIRLAARCVAASSMACLLAPALQAQSVFRLGVEFQVATYTVDLQGQPDVARAPGGDFVVVWTQTAGGGTEIAARRFSGTGNPLGQQLVVNSYTNGNPSLPAVASDDAGNFVVTWISNGQDGSALGVFAQRFDAAGTRRGSEFQVSVATFSSQGPAQVSAESNGDFVVVFSSGAEDGDSFGIFGRRFTSSGVALGGNFQVNAATVGIQTQGSIGLDSDGDFVVAWWDANSDDLLSRHFNSSGVGGAATPVSSITSTSDLGPAVGVDDDGDFVIAWWRAMGDGGGAAIMARRFNELGGPLGPEFQVNSYTPAYQRYPKIAADGDGDFVVTWESQFQDGSGYGAFVQAFDAAGVRIGVELQVNTYTDGIQRFPRVAGDDKGGFVVVWPSYFQDGSGQGVFAQRHATLVALDVDGDGTFEPLTDGILILRFGFGFSGLTLTTGAVSPGCTRCDAAAIEAYLETMS